MTHASNATSDAHCCCSLEAYLDRSKACLVDVSLSATLDYFGKPRVHWGQQFLKVAANQSARWRSFKLRLHQAYAKQRPPAEAIWDTLADVLVPNLQHVDLCADLPEEAWYPLEPEIFLQGTPRLSTLRLAAYNWFWPIIPMDTITTLTIYSEDAPISIRPLLQLAKLQHLNITRKKGSVYHPIEFTQPFEDEDDNDEADSISRLVSIRFPIYDLPSICELPPTLRHAMKTVKHLYLVDRESVDGTWDQLEDLLSSEDINLFPSLEHLNVNLSSMNAAPTLKNYPSLCRLTRNISTLTILQGCLEVEPNHGNSEMTWPRLGRVHLQTLPEAPEECNNLFAWMAERGRRSSGAFVATLPVWQLERLEKMETAGALQKEVQEMKAAVRLETADGVHDDTWPPKAYLC